METCTLRLNQEDLNCTEQSMTHSISNGIHLVNKIWLREGKPPKASFVMPDGDQHMQAGKGRPALRKGEAGEIFEKIFEETFTSKSKFNHFNFNVKKGVEV